MAIYHLKVKPVSRADGRSSTAAAAYRAAAIVYDETTGQTFDYTRKQGVDYCEIVLSTAAAQQDINWAREREALWNAAEKAENRCNSRVAREYEIALPYELNAAQRVELARTFAKDIANRHGGAVDFAIHRPHRDGDDRNHHAHLLATTRTIEPHGLGRKTAIEWSDTDRRKGGLVNGADEITQLRELWAFRANEKLQELAIEARIDHRSLEAQGIDRQPTSHLGPAVSAMQRRGMRTEVGERLEREARATAQQRVEQAAEFGSLARESATLKKSILDLSGDLAGATHPPELPLAKGAKKLLQTPLSLEEIRRQARERWLGMRADVAGGGGNPGPDVGNANASQAASEQARESALARTQTLSLDEVRAQAVTEWREYRRIQGLGPEQGPEPGRGLEKGQTSEKALGKSRGHEGAEFD